MTSVKETQITESGGLGRLRSAGTPAFDHSIETATGGARPLSGVRPGHEGMAPRLTVGTMLLDPKTG